MAREQQYRALMATAGSRDYGRGAATRTPGPVRAVAWHVEHDQDEQGLAGDKQRQASMGGTRVYGADSKGRNKGNGRRASQWRTHVSSRGRGGRRLSETTESMAASSGQSLKTMSSLAAPRPKVEDGDDVEESGGAPGRAETARRGD